MRGLNLIQSLSSELTHTLSDWHAIWSIYSEFEIKKDELFDNDWMIKANSTAPAINVIESDKDYRVEVAAPGMTKNDFNIKIDENNNLVVSMEKKEEKNEDKKDGRYLRREFSYSKFQQTMVLPDNVEKDKIEAKVENGVLSISIPKRTEEEAKMAEKVIEIK